MFLPCIFFAHHAHATMFTFGNLLGIGKERMIFVEKRENRNPKEKPKYKIVAEKRPKVGKEGVRNFPNYQHPLIAAGPPVEVLPAPFNQPAPLDTAFRDSFNRALDLLAKPSSHEPTYESGSKERHAVERGAKRRNAEKRRTEKRLSQSKFQKSNPVSRLIDPTICPLTAQMPRSSSPVRTGNATAKASEKSTYVCIVKQSTIAKPNNKDRHLAIERELFAQSKQMCCRKENNM